MNLAPRVPVRPAHRGRPRGDHQVPARDREPGAVSQRRAAGRRERLVMEPLVRARRTRSGEGVHGALVRVGFEGRDDDPAVSGADAVVYRDDAPELVPDGAVGIQEPSRDPRPRVVLVVVDKHVRGTLGRIVFWRAEDDDVAAGRGRRGSHVSDASISRPQRGRPLDRGRGVVPSPHVRATLLEGAIGGSDDDDAVREREVVRPVGDLRRVDVVGFRQAQRARRGSHTGGGRDGGEQLAAGVVHRREQLPIRGVHRRAERRVVGPGSEAVRVLHGIGRRVGVRLGVDSERRGEPQERQEHRRKDPHRPPLDSRPLGTLSGFELYRRGDPAGCAEKGIVAVSRRGFTEHVT
mmetsp:Transcript_1477/g.5604  ORF Transcript_1477/g.5604 Transcript_1477/m.5604 type:complete len:350 (-) Transcript_1477:56-1105(-)